MEPNKPRLRLWVEALVSGRFHQATDALVNLDHKDPTKRVAHCCLAVAIEVALDNGYVHNDENVWEDGDGQMPAGVAHWFGLEYGNPVIHQDAHGQTLLAITANDSVGWDFGKIANSIDEYYKLNEDQS